MPRVLSCITVACLAVLFGGTASAQYRVTQVLHEPTAADVGPVIAALPADIPPPTPAGGGPIPPAGVAPNNAYGNGRPYHNELPRVSAEFFAMGGTTTHDLAYLRNDSANDITVTTNTIAITSRPKKDVASKPETADPGLVAQFIHGTAASVTIPAGTELSLFLLVTKWLPTVDTSPRDYILTITMQDTVSASTITATAAMTVPKVGGDDSGCVVSDGDGSPAGLILAAMGAMAAILPRTLRRLRRRFVIS